MLKNFKFMRKLSMIMLFSIIFSLFFTNNTFAHFLPTTTNQLKVQTRTMYSLNLTNTLFINYRVYNNTTSSVNISDIKLRHYYTSENPRNVKEYFECDWGYITNNWETITSSVKGTIFKDNSLLGADSYCDITFDSSYVLDVDDYIEFNTRIYKDDWSLYSQHDDYSFNPSLVFINFDKVACFYRGNLVWGNVLQNSSTPVVTTTPSAVVTINPTSTQAVEPTPIPTPEQTQTPDYSKMGKLVLINDEWVFSEKAWTLNPIDTNNFLINLINYTSGNSGKYLVYSENTLAFSDKFLSKFAPQYQVQMTTVFDFTLANLSKYDCVFLAGPVCNKIDLDVLEQYILQGGNIVIKTGTLNFGTYANEASFWNEFVIKFGVNFCNSPNGMDNLIEINSEHELLSNVSKLYFYNGNSILPHGTRIYGNATIIYSSVEKEGVIAVFDKSCIPNITPTPTIEPTVTPEVTPEITPEVTVTPVVIPTPMVTETPETTPEITPEPIPEITPTPEITTTPVNRIKIPVLYYHEIVDGETANMYQMSLTDFRNQMDYLKDNDYTTLTLSDFYTLLNSDELVDDKKYVLLNFDDGCVGQYNYAMPILLDYGFNATFFIAPGLLGTKGFAEYMTALQVREISEYFEVGSHGINHEYMIDYDLEMQKEIVLKSKEAIKDIIDKDPTAFAYQYGCYNDNTIEALIFGDINLGFTANDGIVYTEDNNYLLNRQIIWANITLDEFIDIIK